MIVIFDIDGTLADCRHRIHHITGLTKDWDAFYEKMPEDPIIPPIVLLLESLKAHHEIRYITGRSERWRVATETWMRTNWIYTSGDRIPFANSHLLMRKDGDYRPDHIVKLELFKSMGLSNSQILFAVEDRSRVVQMWRENGIPCLQVADGDY